MQVLLVAVLVLAVVCAAGALAPRAVARRAAVPLLVCAIAACAAVAAVAALGISAQRATEPVASRAVCRGAVRLDPGPVRGAVDLVQRDDGGALPAGGVPPGLETVRIVGWIYAAAKDPASDACILVDGRVAADQLVVYGNARPDVAAATKDPAAARSGYAARLSVVGLAPGPHRVAVALLAADGSYRVAPARGTIVMSR